MHIPTLRWRPSHVLIWTPHVGEIRSWLVRLLAMTADGRPALVAQTCDEDRLGRWPAWVRLEAEEAWRWQGLRGYRGAAGTVGLERVED